MEDSKDINTGYDSDPSLEPETRPETEEFAKDWKTVMEDAITEGKRLRAGKRVESPKYKYKIIEVDRKDRNFKIAKNRYPYTRNMGSRTNPSSPRPCSPYTKIFGLSHNSNSLRTLNSKGQLKSPPNFSKARDKIIRCPLRIAELAEPKKRQCLETWRAETDTLPAYMIERLKQHVLGQKTTVRIPDAINCFKRKPRRMDKTMCAQRSQALARREKEERTAFMNWSAMFAHKISQRLMKPQNITLKNGYERLSNLIAADISEIIGQPKKFHCDYMNDEILKEMSNKVTVWIAGILNDVEYKMLEDELKVKKLKENQLGKDGKLNTLIEKYILAHLHGQSELEEEEGPVLDVLDSLIDTIVNICIPNVPEEKHESSDDGEDDDDAETDNSGSASTGDQTHTTSYPSDSQEYGQDQHFDLSQKRGSEDFIRIREGSSFSDKEEPQSLVELNTEESDIKSILNALIDHADLNVSDIFVVMTEDKNDDKRKVKFNNVDTDSRGVGSVELDIKEEIYKHFNQPTKSVSNTNLKPGIVLSAPNDDLLSIVDELWPNDLKTTMQKSTLDVSKSVTSLGNIFENDADDDKLDMLESPRAEGNVEINVNIEKPASLIDCGNADNKVQKQLSDMTLKPQDFTTEFGKERSVSQETFSDIIQTKAEKVGDSGKGDHDSDESADNKQRDAITKAITKKLQCLKDLKPKFDYRVDIQNAPSWVLHSPSEESLLYSAVKKKNMGVWEIRQWCKNLEHTIINLEQWGTWIGNKCHKMLMLKYHTETEPEHNNRHLKEWLKLKKHTDEDALIWRRLNRRTLDVLETYTFARDMYREDNKCVKYVELKELETMSVFETMCIIDQLSLWTHRLIVSTEYCVKCQCRDTKSQKTKSKHQTR